MAAKLPDYKTLIQAGINPKTGLPLKLGSGNPESLKEDLKRIISIIDRQDAVKRFTWYNLPSGLSGDLIERILYYKGQGMFFYMKTNNTFYFLPYALNGSIDVYGRYLGVTPLIFGGPAASQQNGKEKVWIDGLIREPINEIVLPDEWTEQLIDTKCVLLRDYINDISQTITPRVDLNRPLVNVEAEMIPFMRTSLIGSSGVSGMRVTSQDEQSNVEAASQSVEHAALVGNKWIPIVGTVDFQSLDTSNAANVQEFMLAMNSLDNLRLSTYGLSNGGLFEKQGTILQSEADAAGVNTGLILQDGLDQRQNFCNLVNSLFGLRIWCEITQPATLPQAQDMGADPTGSDYQGEPREGTDNQGGNENE